MNITPDNVVDVHKTCVQQVLAEQYYLMAFNYVCEMVGLANVNEMTDPEHICSFWNEFWAQLPDTRSIHRPPFGLICDLAEGSYLEPPYEDS